MIWSNAQNNALPLAESTDRVLINRAFSVMVLRQKLAKHLASAGPAAEMTDAIQYSVRVYGPLLSTATQVFTVHTCTPFSEGGHYWQPTLFSAYRFMFSYQHESDGGWRCKHRIITEEIFTFL